MRRLDTSVVALGGGHGLHASLSALRLVVEHLTAVVTVADDGGSSGRLREQLDLLPPGDLRMALSALSGDDEWGRTWSRVLQHRFGGEGDLRGHAVGNLLMAGLWDALGDPVTGLDLMGRLLGARGRVLPMSPSPIHITAEVEGPGAVRSTVRGQANVATATGRIVTVALDPAEAPACEEALEAVRSADWVVLGPGSWYTSVIPHLLVADLRAALVGTGHRVVVVLNLSAQAGETDGFLPQDHLAALRDLAPDLRVHAVVADSGSVQDHRALEHAVDEMGARLHVASVSQGPGSSAHDPELLARALHDVMTTAAR